MTEKAKRRRKLIIIAVVAAVLTVLVFFVMHNYWGAAYAEVPEDAGEWHEPQNEEEREQVDEIARRILSGGSYSFDELLYVLDHDSATGQKVLDYLTEQGMNLEDASSASES